MSKNKKEYRQIMKATSLFGGVQIFTIIITIIRSKFVAILLGPTGMGIVGLLQSTINLISSTTNFGLRTSAVKDIATAVSTNNIERVSVVVTVLRRLVWITGLLGALITFITSPWLSQFTFGNSDYTYAFMWLSITLLFNQLSSGQSVVLQGFRKLKLLAKSSMLGSFIGLLTTVPLYYIYGIKGIVPVIIIGSTTTLSLTWYYSKKIQIEKSAISLDKTFQEGKNMLSMGFLISLTGVFSVAVSYIIRIFISNTGEIEDVGLYSAGFAIIGTYVGLIFNAMGTDYYPRLSAVSENLVLAKKTINQQAEIALLIIAPIIIVFLVFIKWTVIILYSNKFIEVNTMVYWAAMGMLFKAISWTIAFLFLAKGESKLFLWNELAVNLYMLGFNIIGYYYWGLTGLGVSFLVTYFLYLIQVYFIAKIKFHFFFTKGLKKIFTIQFSLTALSFIVVYLFDETKMYLTGSLLIIISSWYSLKELDKRMDIKSILVNLKSKFQ